MRKILTRRLRGEFPTPWDVPTEGTFYLVEERLLEGPLQVRERERTVVLLTHPPRTNGSGEIRIHGDLGTTNNVQRWALGQYKLLHHTRTHSWFFATSLEEE